MPMRPTARHQQEGLSRRERQIMDSLYSRGEATVQEIRDDLPDAPTDSAVRALLRLLEGKGHIRHRTDVRRLVYSPAISRERASQYAIRHLMQTFFAGSRERLMQTLLSSTDRAVDNEELDRLIAVIERSRPKGNGS
jgi:BlaI family transcriptional regulator, penicillinase repressor